MAFAELHCHTDQGSNLRLIDSTVKVGSLIDYGISNNLTAIAITDHEALSAHQKAIVHYRSKVLSDETIKTKLILGNEIYLINRSDYQNTDKFWHLLLLATDKAGHKLLRKLSSRAWGRMYSHRGVDRVPTFYDDLYEIINENKGHLVCSTACIGGYLPHLILEGNYEQAKKLCDWFVDLFGEDKFFIELQPALMAEQIEFNKRAVLFAKKYGYNWIITNDIHYLTKEKRELHAAYLNSKQADREVEDFYESCYAKSEDEMLDRLNYLDKKDILRGFENTVKIADMCEFYELTHDVMVPQRSLPKFNPTHELRDYYGGYEYIEKFANSSYEQDRFLLCQIEKGLKEKDEVKDDTNLSRINIELEQLWKISDKLNQRLSAYYNLTQHVIDIMWDDNKGNSLVGVARGSVTGFYICYLIGITQVNPIKWNLPHWRHLHASRPELPDIDIDSQASQRKQIFKSMKDEFGETRCLNTITFKHESSKAAVLTACRGLEIDIDTARELANLVPISRGRVWSIKECLEGNEDNGFTPIRDFVSKIKEYDSLLDVVMEIEGLVSGRSSHASALYIFNNEYIEQNSLMKTPNGTDVTAFDMSDSDSMGGLKVDFLTVEALDKIHKTMDLLIADNKMQWQGNLKKTYDRYLHPDVLVYDNQEMWGMLGDGNIIDVFQFDTIVGGEAVRKIRPTSLKQMAIANSAMRLMSGDGINPVDRFVSFRDNISLWYEEMQKEGLTSAEIKTLEKYLLPNFGCSVEQEDIMELSMDDNIAEFDLKLANKLRKGIAKKVKSIIEDAKELFYDSGLKIGTRIEMLDYVWNFCVKPSLGYSFSRSHTNPYSTIGLQEMNLAYFYPVIYWNTACLTINASANEDIGDNKSTDYGKIAKAIGDMQQSGIKVALPDINTANFGFKPSEKEKQIIFGLKGINGIGDDVVSYISTFAVTKSQ